MLLPLLIACAQDAYFVDATHEAGVAFRHVSGAYGEHHFIETMGPGVAFLDYDNDGYLDIYAVNGQYLSDTTAIRATNVLYRNNGDGTFTDVTREAGVFDPDGKGMGICCGDYDGDGDVDIYVANDRVPNFLYSNEGDGTFTEVALFSGVAYNEDGREESSMGVDFGDYDNDGDLDIFVPDFQGETFTLYRNEGDGFFVDASSACGIAASTLK